MEFGVSRLPETQCTGSRVPGEQGRIWLPAEGWPAAWWPRPARRCQGGGRPEHGPPRPGRRRRPGGLPVGKHPGQRLVLEISWPQLVVHEAGRPLGFRQARMAVLQQRACSPSVTGWRDEAQPPPTNPPAVVGDIPRGQLVAEPAWSLVEATLPAQPGCDRGPADPGRWHSMPARAWMTGRQSSASPSRPCSSTRGGIEATDGGSQRLGSSATSLLGP